ncbi:MAG TPA: type ISP restriction/modification enzyme [Verrucomicrobiae bacterium]|nr:type ISP restriction/modification enzyme [Verrucomicrobiae bacterium]
MIETGSGNSENSSAPDFLHEEPPPYGGSGKPSPVFEYLRKLERALKRGDSTEHTHRAALQELLEAINEKIVATNEPKRSSCGAPDYVISRKRDHLSVGYIEAKDVGADLTEIEKSGQLKRYLQSLPSLLLTDYVEFRWFVDGRKRETFRLANVSASGKLTIASSEELERARHLLISFLSKSPVDIASAEELAKRLANLTHNIRDIIICAFQTDAASQQLRDWRDAFSATLLPELAEQGDAKKEAEAVNEFADMFAQTLAYGLFSARAASYGVKFTREKAQKLIPRTNPFLRTFFEQITGSALDDEPFAGFVEDLIQTLDHADMARILEDFGKRGRRRDPVVHFYETFLQAYDPKLRELRGVYYTPEPVVNYIVQSIDRLLKDKFGIKAGLADHSKITVKRKEGEREITDETHRVLILDPATGTATFLYTVLDFIRSQFKTKKNAGQWGSYVHEHLLPRLFGFELLMAPYAVAHFKLGLALAAMDEEPLFRQQWSYEPHANERVNVFLTNTLEDLERTTEQLGPLRALSDEANSAYEVKKHKPVLVVLGNPPYSGHSANKGEWISRLVRDYYFCDGKPLGEKNPKWLQDDYVKFLRWAQWRIEQTGQGVLAFITNHGYLDNPTFRGMRYNLMQTFDEIYVLDLHGNAKKKETVPNSGEADKNVFDIQQGVAISIFVKLPKDSRGKKKEEALAAVGHCHLWGAQRQTKYDWLDDHHVENTEWTTLEPLSPNYLLIPQDTRRFKEYERAWKITEMMPVFASTITTARNHFSMAFEPETLSKRIRILRNPDKTDDELKRQFNLQDVSYWKLSDARKELAEIDDVDSFVRPYCYRPFDDRFVYYHPAVCERLRTEVMSHVQPGNISLLTHRPQSPSGEFSYIFSTMMLGDQCVAANKTTGGGNSFQFPLYLYPNGKLPEEDLFAHDNGRRPNLSAEFIKDFCEALQVKFVPDGLGRPGKREVGPELIFHYAYAVFHSPTYRERYAEFLRADFPRLPLTSDFELFRILCGFGGDLVDLHARGKGTPKGLSFPEKGSNVIEEVRYQPPQGKEPGRVWINDKQYIEGVPESAWAFPIGGYLPAQRWLKDRIGRTLGYDEREEYCRIVWALMETQRLMGEIDAAIEEHGGWPLR